MRLRLAGLAAAACLLVGLLGVGTAVSDPLVVRYAVPIVGLARPVRVVQLSDVHGAIDMPVWRIRRIVRQANGLRPDLVVLTGDYGGEIGAVVGALAGLRAPLGVVGVSGNNDDPVVLKQLFGARGMRLLDGMAVDVGPLVVAGAGSIAHLPPPVVPLRAAIDGAAGGKPVISISHEPETANYGIARTQLHIAGHTHGGQVGAVLLWLFAPSDPWLLAHLRGRFLVQGRPLIVSAGLGTSRVPVRFGVRPEIVVVTLVPGEAGR